MVSRKEIMDDIHANGIEINIDDYSTNPCGNYRKATDEEIANMTYWELWRSWEQAKYTLALISGLRPIPKGR